MNTDTIINLRKTNGRGTRIVVFGIFCYACAILIRSFTCESTNLNDLINKNKKSNKKSSIIAITPTYHRLDDRNMQAHLLLTLRNTLCASNIPILWILIESSKDFRRSALIEKYANESRDLLCELLYVKALHVSMAESSYHRGVEQRNAALDWIQNSKLNDGVILFIDDDNAYDVLHFQNAAKVERIKVWPIGFPSSLSKFEAPVMSDKVIGFRSFWCGQPNHPPRLFAIDMCGFGIRLSSLGDARFDSRALPGYLEDLFLQNVTKNIINGSNPALTATSEDLLNVLEFDASSDEINVWHLYHKKQIGGQSSAEIIHRVPTGESFICPKPKQSNSNSK